MGGLGHFLQIALAVLTLSSLAGLGLMRGTVVKLREDLTDADRRIGARDDEIAELKASAVREEGERLAREAAMQTQIDSQKEQIDNLRDDLAGKQDWDAINTKLDMHVQETQREAGVIEGLLQDLLKSLLDLLQRGAK